MEESDKRRERLRAMRMEASQFDSSPIVEADSNPSVLFNPLIETPGSQDPSAAPRFDFYTDPMAAFSNNKRPSNISSQNLQGYFPLGGGNPVVRFPPSPLGPRYPRTEAYTHQSQTRRTPYMETYQPGCHHDSSGPIRSPSTMMGPNPMYQGPGSCNENIGASCYYPYYSPRALNSPVTGQYFSGSSPNPNMGDGWTHSPSLGRRSGQLVGDGGGSGGRRRGYHQGDYPSRGFYDKSMVEDPWKKLKPVIWKGSNFLGVSSALKKTPYGFQGSSSNSKKPRVVETSNTSESKQSLADFLASAFDDAVEEAGVRQEEAV